MEKRFESRRHITLSNTPADVADASYRFMDEIADKIGRIKFSVLFGMPAESFFKSTGLLQSDLERIGATFSQPGKYIRFHIGHDVAAERSIAKLANLCPDLTYCDLFEKPRAAYAQEIISAVEMCVKCRSLPHIALDDHCCNEIDDPPTCLSKTGKRCVKTYTLSCALISDLCDEGHRRDLEGKSSAAEYDGEPWERFKDCGFVPRLSHSSGRVAKPMWLPAALQLIMAVAYAYRSVRDAASDAYDEALDKISEQLDALEDHLDEIDQTLDEIRTSIDILPQKIKGLIRDSAVDQALGRASAACETINYHIDTRTIEQNLKMFKLDLRQIHNEVSVITRLLDGGLATVIVTSPLIAVWLSGAVSVERFLRERSGNDPINFPHLPESPWQHPLMALARRNLAVAIQDFKDQEVSYAIDIIPDLPFHSTQYIVNRNAFRASNFDSVHTPWPGTLPIQIICPGSADERESLQAFHYTSGDRRYRWIDITENDLLDPGRFGNSIYHGAEIAAGIRYFFEQRKAIFAFYQVIPEVLAKESDLMNSFVEPTVW